MPPPTCCPSYTPALKPQQGSMSRHTSSRQMVAATGRRRSCPGRGRGRKVERGVAGGRLMRATDPPARQYCSRATCAADCAGSMGPRERPALLAHRSTLLLLGLLALALPCDAQVRQEGRLRAACVWEDNREGGAWGEAAAPATKSDRTRRRLPPGSPFKSQPPNATCPPPPLLAPPRAHSSSPGP